jgi:hypothetical protein
MEGAHPKTAHEEAGERVGEQPEARLRWLVDFAQEDMSALTRGRAVDLFEEIKAFVFAGLPSDVGDRVIGHHFGEDEDERDFVRNLHGRWRAALQQLLDEGMFVYEATARYVLGRDPDGAMEFGMTADTEPGFFIAVFRLLSEQGGRLRRCSAQGCSRIFVGPERQTFCGARCAQRVRTRRFRQQQNAEVVSNKRHEAYAKRVRAKHGPKTKVGRRPRRRRPG